MTDEQRSKRSAKKPAWMNDEMLIDPAEVEPEMKLPRQHARRPQAASDMVPRMLPTHEVLLQRPCRPGRMCSNPQCKNPYDSPQWRRGPLGPGTLCNACGTRYARLQAKMNGDKKGKMRPQERAEWEAFEQQRLNPPTAQTWRLHVQQFVQREQQLQYYTHEQEYTGYEDSDYGYDERSYGSQQLAGHRRQHLYDGAEDPEVTEDGQLLCQEGLSDSPDVGSRAAIAAAVAAGSRPSSRSAWRGARQLLPAVDAATDSQEDEAGAYSCQDVHAGAAGAGGMGSPAAPSFLHLLAVGEAMIKTEGVAPQDRRAAWTEVVEKCLSPEPDKPSARAAAGEAAQGVKRSRFALEAEEQQGARVSQHPEPTALQRALERFGPQPAQQRTKPAPAGEPSVPPDSFERLLAEAECAIRARSVSPCMLKGLPGSSPTCNMPSQRPITPLQLGASAVDTTAGRSGVSRTLLGIDAFQHDGHQNMAGFMLPAAAAPRRKHTAGSENSGRSRHASLAQVLAAAVAAEVNSMEDSGADLAGGLQDSPGSQQYGSAIDAATGGDEDAALAAVGAGRDDDIAAAVGASNESSPRGMRHLRVKHTAEQAHRRAHSAMQEQLQVLLAQRGQALASEPRPLSKPVLADEVLSPTDMLLPSRPCKQPRTSTHPQSPAASGAQWPTAISPGGSSQQQQSEQPGLGGAAAAPGTHMAQHELLQPPQLSMLQQLGQHGLTQPFLLQPVMLQHAQGQPQQQLAAGQAAQATLPTAAQLQQAGQQPVVLACQLVLQQQANPAALRPLFEVPVGCTNPQQVLHQGSAGPSSGAAGIGQHLAHPTSGNSTQNHLDQLKAATESAVAAAATASAVAAATALLWQQLQQQEQARERMRQQQQEQRQQQQQQQNAEAQQQGQQDQQELLQANRSEGALQDVADAAAVEDAAPDSPAPPPSGPDASDAIASGSVSRSSSSSTSAAGLSAAPADGHNTAEQPLASHDQSGGQQKQQEHCGEATADLDATAANVAAGAPKYDPEAQHGVDPSGGAGPASGQADAAPGPPEVLDVGTVGVDAALEAGGQAAVVAPAVFEPPRS